MDFINYPLHVDANNGTANGIDYYINETIYGSYNIVHVLAICYDNND